MSWNPRYANTLKRSGKFIENRERALANSAPGALREWGNTSNSFSVLGNSFRNTLGNNNSNSDPDVAKIITNASTPRLPNIPRYNPRNYPRGVPSIPRLNNLNNFSNRLGRVSLTPRVYKMQSYLMNKIKEIESKLDKTFTYLEQNPGEKNTNQGQRALDIADKLLIQKKQLEQKLIEIKRRNSNTRSNFRKNHANNNYKIKMLNASRASRRNLRSQPRSWFGGKQKRTRKKRQL
jgi:hypothetical protein